jgi:hypothetical protein
MTTKSSLKTEHAGAKNGGGYFGRRARAKTASRTKRRHDDKAEVQVGSALEVDGAASLVSW